MADPSQPAASLFVYGTLRQPEVQRAIFGRALARRPDALPGFALSPMAITDQQAIATSGSVVHTIALRTGKPADLVAGLVLSVTPAELEAADDYEVAGYFRIAVRLASGKEAFVYVGGGS